MISRKFNLLIPLILLVLNTIFLSFLIENIIDASEPHYGGGWELSTPIFGLISLIYIKKFTEKKSSALVRILQGLNWIFIIFPVVYFLSGVFIMINY
ncbi:hypothetical protein CSE16_08900 [Solibacillus sp. R5-41]|uniref:hypothetical protein n=1 Tax=Solibacillus sp. R5-41 TaxID=2048654 RepID=UPI000C12628B|nr:hypothetical protein [Solibacillus sp. R5-41]ATP40157.1 hypothetical protein CSE16_08900 [Solibacillus sp. R5-41]